MPQAHGGGRGGSRQTRSWRRGVWARRRWYVIGGRVTYTQLKRSYWAGDAQSPGVSQAAEGVDMAAWRHGCGKEWSRAGFFGALGVRMLRKEQQPWERDPVRFSKAKWGGIVHWSAQARPAGSARDAPPYCRWRTPVAAPVHARAAASLGRCQLKSAVRASSWAVAARSLLAPRQHAASGQQPAAPARLPRIPLPKVAALPPSACLPAEPPP